MTTNPKIHDVLFEAIKSMPSDYTDYGGMVRRWDNEETDYPDCSCGCRHFLPLDGPLGSDWGVCANRKVDRFGLLTFEHQTGSTCFEPMPGSYRHGPSFAPLVPELMVSNLAASLQFWCELAGFSVAYARPEEGFAFLYLGGAQVMLEDISVPGRKWLTGPLEKPFRRELNFEIGVDDAGALCSVFEAAGWPIYLPLETKTYRTSDASAMQSQFAVQDPDGYLLRFSQSLSQA